jgi:hypothetical protein
MKPSLSTSTLKGSDQPFSELQIETVTSEELTPSEIGGS